MVHPGGTCYDLIRSIDDRVTEIEGLLINDASLIPGAFGLPPILTIVALVKNGLFLGVINNMSRQ